MPKDPDFFCLDKFRPHVSLHKEDERTNMLDKLARYFRTRVEVKAQDILYRGFLTGADEDYLYLIGETMYMTIPMENVTSVRPEQGNEEDRLMKKVEGEGPQEEGLKESKRRYGAHQMDDVHKSEEKGRPNEGEAASMVSGNGADEKKEE